MAINISDLTGAKYKYHEGIQAYKIVKGTDTEFVKLSFDREGAVEGAVRVNNTGNPIQVGQEFSMKEREDVIAAINNGDAMFDHDFQNTGRVQIGEYDGKQVIEHTGGAGRNRETTQFFVHPQSGALIQVPTDQQQELESSRFRGSISSEQKGKRERPGDAVVEDAYVAEYIPAGTLGFAEELGLIEGSNAKKGIGKLTRELDDKVEANINKENVRRQVGDNLQSGFNDFLSAGAPVLTKGLVAAVGVGGLMTAGKMLQSDSLWKDAVGLAVGAVSAVATIVAGREFIRDVFNGGANIAATAVAETAAVTSQVVRSN